MAPLTDGRAWARLLIAGSLVLGLLFMSSPAGAIDIPFDPTPIPGEDACNNLDAPIPASPHGFGSFIINPGVDPAGRSPDPFGAEHPASLESVYGTSPQWFTFDNGCTGQFMAGAGTALGNILLELGGILPNWSHVLLHSVLSPGSWLIALEKPVLEATGATVQGVWSPWLPVVVLLAAALIFLRARAGRVAQSASSAAWALLVLGVSSMLINYPVEIVHMVDDGVRNITGLIASGFNDGNAIPEDPKDLGDEAAVVAVDAQFDEMIRTTQYRTWVIGVFGSPDSQTAIDYGPEVFAATHFTWEEYATYREDPEDAGAKIVEKKADVFKTSAEQIKETDPLAYEYFTGEHWSQRLTTSLINLAILIVTCGFLLFASLATVLAYALIRLIVPFAPVMGVLFMIDRTRDAAVSMLKYIVGPPHHRTTLLPGRARAPAVLLRHPLGRDHVVRPQTRPHRCAHLPGVELSPTTRVHGRTAADPRPRATATRTRITPRHPLWCCSDSRSRAASRSGRRIHSPGRRLHATSSGSLHQSRGCGFRGVHTPATRDRAEQTGLVDTVKHQPGPQTAACSAAAGRGGNGRRAVRLSHRRSGPRGESASEPDDVQP